MNKKSVPTQNPLVLLFISRRSGPIFPYFLELSKRSAYPISLVSNRNFLCLGIRHFIKYVFGGRKRSAATISQDFLQQAVQHRVQEKLLKKGKNSLVGRNKLINMFYKQTYTFLYQKATLILWTLYYDHIAVLSPSLFLVWNGARFWSSIAADAAKKNGVQCIYFENGLLPNTTTMDTKGINDDNSLPRKADFYLQYANTHSLEESGELLKEIAKYKKVEENPILFLPRKTRRWKKQYYRRSNSQFGEDLPQSYLFIPFQINQDSQILQNSQWISDMFHLFAVFQKVKSLITDKDIHLVFKTHPKCRENYTNLYQDAEQSSHILFADFHATSRLIQNAKAIITINSTVGWEALLLGKKVITLGNACYNIPGLVQHAGDSKSLIAAINHLDDWQLNKKLQSAYLSYTHDFYCIPEDWRKGGETHWNAVNERLGLILAGRAWLPS